MPATKLVDVDFALQGGGSHGAFTWGVIDRLLEEDNIVIEAVSGTSAGAMNACALVEGLTVGGREAARDKLREYWTAVSRSASLSPFRRGPLDQFAGRWSLANSPWFAWSKALFRQFSPYEFNPFDINPLKNLVESTFDFEAINLRRRRKYSCAPRMCEPAGRKSSAKAKSLRRRCSHRRVCHFYPRPL
jgi:NTE family protein